MYRPYTSTGVPLNICNGFLKNVHSKQAPIQCNMFSINNEGNIKLQMLLAK